MQKEKVLVDVKKVSKLAFQVTRLQHNDDPML